MLGFFSEPIKIYFLIWSYWAHAWACQASAQGKVSDVKSNIIMRYSARSNCFGISNRTEKYKLMFRWSQNGRSTSTETSNLSGEDFFQPSTATKTEWILITDFKQLPGLMKTKMVMYIIASKLNYTFGTIGNATADKMTAKVVEKLEPFALAWRNINLNRRSCSEACEM